MDDSSALLVRYACARARRALVPWIGASMGVVLSVGVTAAASNELVPPSPTLRKPITVDRNVLRTDERPKPSEIRVPAKSHVRGRERSADKGLYGALSRASVCTRREIRGMTLEWQPFDDRQLARCFPNSSFHRLFARTETDEYIGLGVQVMGQALVLPHDINLLCILEDRPTHEGNLRPMAEMIVRMIDPEGPTSQKVLAYGVRPNASRNGQRAVLETLSFNQRLKKRWTIEMREDRFYSLEERTLSYRPVILENRPEQSSGRFDDEVSSSDDAKTIAFWRSPDARKEMARIRADWLARNRAGEASGSKASGS